MELAVEGNGYRFKTRFNRFRNLPELLTMFREIADVQTRDQLDLDVPEAEYRVQVAKLDTYGRKIMDSFVTRAEQIHNGGVDASVDNFFLPKNAAPELMYRTMSLPCTISTAHGSRHISNSGKGAGYGRGTKMPASAFTDM